MDLWLRFDCIPSIGAVIQDDFNLFNRLTVSLSINYYAAVTMVELLIDGACEHSRIFLLLEYL